MNPIALRRAFRARPGTEDCMRLAGFLEGLGSSEPAWQSLVALLESDVIPIVVRCHPDVECDEISSACFAGAFESWIPEWLNCARSAAQVRQLVAEARHSSRWFVMCGSCGDAVGLGWLAQRVGREKAAALAPVWPDLGAWVSAHSANSSARQITGRV
ncbi:MAG: hypothetical protein JRH01_18385 [Deltaproteobacteria bacterium]|nr:hypothetical protein [Deltaproteobacteria bacterium]MBW2395946.1 hypothetical protein [Deltaproteobacteria bacterium]